MGSFATLGIGNFELDWQKNHLTSNHGSLFQTSDFTTRKMLQEDPSSEEELEFEEQKVLVRKLSQMKRRLWLLGYSEFSFEDHFKFECKMWEEHSSEKAPFTFKEFEELVKKIDLDNFKIDFDYYSQNADMGELAQSVFKSAEISNDAGVFLESLQPYFALGLLSTVEANLQREVVWDFYDLVRNGWIKEDEVSISLEASSKFIIVTEGSSDTNILKKAITHLAPDVVDFFTFIDMKDNYPFTGTGNLMNFCKGLASIQVQNKILVIYDNDIAGVKHFNQSRNLNLPTSMSVVCLPHMKEFESFKTIGTDGESVNDINGKAVSIECFLDLNYKFNTRDSDPRIRWKNYDDEMGHYHGALEFKENYAKKFFESDLMTENYATDKLKALIDFVLLECSKISALVEKRK